MRVIARSTLHAFMDPLAGHKERQAVKGALDAWFHDARQATWKSMADVKRRYANASIVTSDRAVFNIKGNSYRLVAAIDFEKEIIWIKWVGSHKDYDRIDVVKVRHAK